MAAPNNIRCFIFGVTEAVVSSREDEEEEKEKEVRRKNGG
jgi:hypothetical protein